MRLDTETQTTELVHFIHALFDEEMLLSLKRIYNRASLENPSLSPSEFFSYLPDNFIPSDLRKNFSD